MCSRGPQLRTSLQQLHKMRTGDDPLQSAIRDYRELVDIVAGHEFQRIQHLRVRSDDVQLFEWSHGLAHRSAFPTIARDGANVPQSYEAHEPAMVLHGETALAAPQNVCIHELLQAHAAVDDGAVV